MKKVAIQGTLGSYHDIAAHKYFEGEEIQLICCASFEDVFAAVKQDSQTIGMLAIENTIAGSLLHNNELLRQSGTQIVGEYKLRISHSFVCLPDEDWDDITEVNSHPIALMQYYDRLAQQIHGNIYIYNFPDNTGYTIPPETVLALAKIHPNIVGMKDTVAGMDHTRELIKVVKSHIPQFEIYSGFDDNFAHNVLSGGDGCIGALSNVVPEVCAAWVRAFRENDLAGIAKGQQIIDRLMDLYTVRSPFLPVIKEACRLRGIAATSVGTFPMPSATVEDDARILELLNREGIQ